MALSGIELSSRRFLWICSLVGAGHPGADAVASVCTATAAPPPNGTIAYRNSVVQLWRSHYRKATWRLSDETRRAYTPDSVLPVRKNKLNYRYRTNFSADCEQYVYCNLLHRFDLRYLGSSILLFTGAPTRSRRPRRAAQQQLRGHHALTTSP
ncbi:hypothetical protein EVAR_101743_1 [Eumeta japonica]|uniref:Uncharacterized protein n=1 Tax=Eumeta variegata TaxID=151549 RepID=A0A4C1SMA7_EUMVA|nr:hypothetical protein EVAR_101743_1 [Eumeta japonica]